MKERGSICGIGSASYRMPESFSAFWRMVSLTAAKTSRMLDVSVACVRLASRVSEARVIPATTLHLLWIEVEMCSVDLVEPPEKVLRRPVDVVSTRVVGEVVDQGRSAELLLEQIDLVEEEDDARPHEPPRVDHRVEEDETLHHSVLHIASAVSLLEARLRTKEAHLIALFQQHLVVFAQGDAEDDRRDILETMDPLLPLAPLSTNIEHAGSLVSSGLWWDEDEI